MEEVIRDNVDGFSYNDDDANDDNDNEDDRHAQDGTSMTWRGNVV